MIKSVVRSALRRQARFHVLALGDSHVRVFEHWSFMVRMPRTHFEVVHVAGATAFGIHNPRSVTQARRIFREALARSRADLVLVHLGEVDTAYTIWRHAERHGRDPKALVRMAIDRYWDFIMEVRATHRVAVLSACLPTLADQGASGDDVAAVRSSVAATHRERTRLTLDFNAQLASRCEHAGIPFLDSGRAALGPAGVVQPSWVNRRRYDHHYERGRFARWLITQLRQRLEVLQFRDLHSPIPLSAAHLKLGSDEEPDREKPNATVGQAHLSETDLNPNPEWLFNTDAPGDAMDTVLEHLQLNAVDASAMIERTASPLVNAERLTATGCGPVIALAATKGAADAAKLVAIADALPPGSVLHVYQQQYMDPRRPNIVARFVPAESDREFLLKTAGHVHKLVQAQPAGSRFVPARVEFPQMKARCAGLDAYLPTVGEREAVSLEWDGVPYEFLSDLRVGSRRLVVFGQDAIDRKRIALPHFYRWSWLPELEASAIILNDPSLYADENLLAGWWVGTRTRDYIREATAIVRRAMQALEISPEEVTFFGASAGGFSALAMAAALPGARAVVDIPQVCLATYGARIASDASILAGLDYARAEDVPATLRHRVDIIERFVHERNVPEFLYLQNSQDQTHIGAQMGLFLQRLGELMAREEWAQSRFRVEVYSARNLLKGGHFPLSRADTLREINSYIANPVRRRRQVPVEPSHRVVAA